MISAFSMITSSAGTSWWPDLEVVATPLILSTTSCACGHFAEYRVAPALNVLAAVVEEAVVSHVDEELRGSRMRLHGAGHGDGVLVVGKAVVSFVLDAWALVFLFFHAWLETAALDHEVTDDAVENGVFVVTGFNVFDEVGHGDRGFLGVQFEDDVTVVGVSLTWVMIGTLFRNSWFWDILPRKPVQPVSARSAV
jgi:hypothetical protein